MSDPTLDQITLRLDIYGTDISNKIVDEIHTLTSINDNTYHILIPKFAPFYLENLVVKHIVGAQINTLVHNVDYYAVLPYVGATRSVGKLLVGGISIINDAITSGTILVTYQALGGVWVADSAEVLRVLAERAYNPKTTIWDIITNKPNAFPPTSHDLSLSHVNGYSEIIAAVNRLSDSILNTANETALAINHLTDTNNPHNLTKAKLGLSNVENKHTATDVEVTNRIAADKYITLRQSINLINGYGGSITGTGAITSVTASAPLVSSGGVSPIISMPAVSASTAGYMTIDQFNKLSSLENYNHPNVQHIPTGGTSNQVLKSNDSGVASWVDDSGSTYDHPPVNHIPTGGAIGQVLKNTASGTASWVNDDISGSNLVKKFLFADNDKGGWSSGIAYGLGRDGLGTLRITTRNTTEDNNKFVVKPNEILYISCDVSTYDRTSTGKFGLLFFDKNNSYMDPINTTAERTDARYGASYISGTAFYRIVGSVVVPSWAIKAVPWIFVDIAADLPVDDYVSFTRLYISRHEEGATKGATWDSNIIGQPDFGTGAGDFAEGNHTHTNLVPTGGNNGDVLQRGTGNTLTWGTVTSGSSYSHPPLNHIPTDGSTGQILKWDSSGTAKWETEYSYTHPDTDGTKHLPINPIANKILKCNASGTPEWANEPTITLPAFSAF